MSVKYTQILETVEDGGTQVPSYYGKYLVHSYEEALAKAKEYDFTAGVRVDGVEKGDLFNTKEEFEEVIQGKAYPVAIVPLV